jgi:hypothetical protein
MTHSAKTEHGSGKDAKLDEGTEAEVYWLQVEEVKLKLL